MSLTNWRSLALLLIAVAAIFELISLFFGIVDLVQFLDTGQGRRSLIQLISGGLFVYAVLASLVFFIKRSEEKE